MGKTVSVYRSIRNFREIPFKVIIFDDLKGRKPLIFNISGDNKFIVIFRKKITSKERDKVTKFCLSIKKNEKITPKGYRWTHG